MIRAVVLFLVLSLTQTATFGGEPHSFYYFKADYCGPCRKFKVASPRLVPALESMFVCVPAINLETPEGKRLGVTFEITRIPAFIVVDANGYEVGRFTGFTPGNEPEFLRRCRVLANSTTPRNAVRRTNPRGRTERPQTNPPPVERPRETPRASNDGSAIAEANRRLRDELDESETARRIANDEAEAARRREQAIRKAREVDRETIAELRRRLEESLAPLWKNDEGRDEDLIDSIVGPAEDPKPTAKPPAKPEQPAATKPAENAKPETQTPPTPPKQPASESEKTDLSSKWAGVVMNVAKIGVAIAAPEAAIPLSVGSGVLTYLYSRRKKRRLEQMPKSPPVIESPLPPVTAPENRVDRPPVVPPPIPPEPAAEVTRYRNVPVDREARRLREAMRRVADQYPTARGFVNLVENAVRLIRSGERT